MSSLLRGDITQLYMRALLAPNFAQPVSLHPYRPEGSSKRSVSTRACAYKRYLKRSWYVVDLDFETAEVASANSMPTSFGVDH